MIKEKLPTRNLPPYKEKGEGENFELKPKTNF